MSGDPRTPPERRLADLIAFPPVRGNPAPRARGRPAPVLDLETYRGSRADRIPSPGDGVTGSEHGRASVIDLAVYRAAREPPGLDPAA
jgi:hypothetical protein